MEKWGGGIRIMLLLALFWIFVVGGIILLISLPNSEIKSSDVDSYIMEVEERVRESGEIILYSFRQRTYEGIREVYSWVVIEDSIIQFRNKKLSDIIKKDNIVSIDSELAGVLITLKEPQENALDFKGNGEIEMFNICCFPEVMAYLEDWFKN